MSEIMLENSSCVVRSDQLTPVQRDSMFKLLDTHFEGVTAEQFERDLAEKNIVILIYRGEQLVGFSTLLAYETSFRGDPVSVVYSGDTIVAPEAWGSTALFRAWIRSVKALRSDFSRGKFYWLLLTSGFRTYRLLPVFWRHFFPRIDFKVSSEQKALLDHLSRERFGARYDAIQGIVRFDAPQRLRSRLLEVPVGRELNPHVAYFLSRNPQHCNGDELVCLTELDDSNLTAAGRRMIR